jgi:serpin B
MNHHRQRLLCATLSFALLTPGLTGCKDSRANPDAAGSGGGKAVQTPTAGSGGAGQGAAGNLADSGVNSGSADDAAVAATGGVIERSMVAADTAPAISTEDYATFIAHINQFGFDLGQKVAASNDLSASNIVYSPLSAAYALAMTYAGARGKTAEEMKAVLGDSFGDMRFHQAANALARQLETLVHGQTLGGSVHKVDLNVTDALFARLSLPLKADFLDLLATEYDSGVHRVDFAGDPEAARVTINDWVSGQTHAKVNDLFPAGSIDGQAQLVLVNALYFFGSWANAINPVATRDADFHPSAAATVQVPTMHFYLSTNYHSEADFALAELPYDGNGLRMTVVLPAEGKFDELRTKTSAAWLQHARSNLSASELVVSLPKFKVTTGTVSLRQGLEDLGMKLAFTDQSDLSGISTEGPLVIADVLQKAYIEVNENGTEAAAATAVLVAGRSAPAPQVPFTVDRPFLFFIQNVDDAVLFSGQVIDPTQH